MNSDIQTIFDLSVTGRTGYSLPACDVPETALEELIPSQYLRTEAAKLPELSEIDVVRHFTGLSKKNHGVDGGFYPLGSCTMKYNPKINEDTASLAGFTNVHPLQPEQTVQGCLEILFSMDQMLAEITGMDGMTFQPAAGAHGELTGLMILKAYHESRGDIKRKKILVPDSAHGTNPASAMAAGFDVVEIRSDARGNIELADLKSHVGEDTAGLMLTNPNTLGLFDDHILDIAEVVHQAGGLLYYDGANANAIVGVCRPGDMGFDIIHLNLHKTFSTPHGGGGPGAGPVGVKKALVPFLPGPTVVCEDGSYRFAESVSNSIGRVKSFYGNFNVIVKAYTYLCSIGVEGIKDVAQVSVLNANYLRVKLQDYFKVAYDRTCMHEVVLSATPQKTANGVSANDIAKRLIDFGFHPPTVYFPLIVHEAMMVEPTETESKETLDQFISAMIQIAHEAQDNPDLVKGAPHTTVFSHFDETQAARFPVLIWKSDENK